MEGDRPNRKSIRLKGHDYAQSGAYFITLCVQNHLCLFGDIVDGEMILNDAGIMVERWWLKMAEKFNVYCSQFVIMPNQVFARGMLAKTTFSPAHVPQNGTI